MLFLLLLVPASLAVKAQKLSFNEEGSFKIAQFTDLHYIHGNPKSDTTLLLLERILDAEKPDMIAFTGDIVTGKPVLEGWKTVTRIAIDRKIPFMVTLGNHDHEHGLTREEIADYVTTLPFHLNHAFIPGVSGVMNDVIPIYGSKDRLTPKALLYSFDSGAYSYIEGIEGYGWITLDQIEWYRKTSMGHTIRNHLQPLPALAFFHIPLPEYRQAFNDEKNIRFGVRREDECSPELNTGLFFSMKEMGDVMGTFVGHDHVNNYIVNYHGIALAYGHFSGWKTTYTPETNGARIIVLKENKREFDTWLRQLDGNISLKVTFPSGFVLSNE